MNCRNFIGTLETAYLWGGHVVCVACYGRLSAAAPPPVATIADDPYPSRPEIIFQGDGVTVTSQEIITGWKRIPLDRVLSVRPRKRFLPGGMIVDVLDLVRHSTSYTFSKKDTAARFVAAIRQANGAVSVEKEDEGGWFIIWG